MKLSKISQKLPAIIGLMAIIFTIGNCDLLKKTKRTIEPVAWADINKDGVKDAIIKKVIETGDPPFGPIYDETLVAVDGRSITKEEKNYMAGDSYNIVIGAFGNFENIEGLMINPKRYKWGKYGSYIPLHARILASKDGKFSDVSFEDNGLRISAEISTTSEFGPSMPNRYRLSGIRSLGYKVIDPEMIDFLEKVKKDK